MSAPDSFLLDLFREEMTASGAVLTDGLLSLERQGASPESIEPLMRAAHSIKGAARVVELTPLVRVAHAMEDVLVSAGDGKVHLISESIDRLLGALDWMMEICALKDEDLQDWLDQQLEATDHWVQDIAAIHQLDSAPAPISSAQQAQTLAVEEPPVMAAAPQPSVSAQPGQEDGINPASVKIATETLNRMLAYSADMLLESRRIEQTAHALHTMKQIQRDLNAQLRDIPFEESTRQPVEQLLDQLASATSQHEQALLKVAGRTGQLAERLHDLALRGRMRPFADGMHGFPRLVRDLARQLGKEAELEIVGQATLVDRDILARLDAPLNHLLRNAIDHGLESPERRTETGKPGVGRLRLAALHRGGRLIISVGDDGRGIDPEALRKKVIDRQLAPRSVAERLTDSELYDFLCLPGFTTRESVSEVSGRGVGLDVVQTMVHACGGTMKIGSVPGKGTRFELQLPVTRSVIRVLLADIAGQTYAFPMARIDRAERIEASRLECLNGYYFLSEGSEKTAVVSARRILGQEEIPARIDQYALIRVSAEGRRYAIEVDALRGGCDVVVRPLDARLGKIPNLTAAALDDAGQPLLILDVEDMIRSADRLSGVNVQPSRRRTEPASGQQAKRILVVDDSITVREVERRLLENSGYEVEVAVDGVDGWNTLNLRKFDLVVSDIDMPRMNGLELITRIKSDTQLGRTPVIIVSYKDRDEDRLRGMEAGADYYLTKSSFHDASLVQAVQDLIGGAAETS